jgi:hypothetical protein
VVAGIRVGDLVSGDDRPVAAASLDDDDLDVRPADVDAEMARRLRPVARSAAVRPSACG